jgi:hypothetical protein
MRWPKWRFPLALEPGERLLTPNDVVMQLAELGRELDGAVKVLKRVEAEAVLKRHEADLAESHAFVNATGPMDMRKHLARLEAAKFEQDALVAEAALRWLRAQIRSIDTRIEVGRSYGAAVRAEMKMIPYDCEP